MFGKLMSIPDKLILHYGELAAFYNNKQLAQLKKRLKAGENPRDVKESLAIDIVSLYYPAKTAAAAAGEFRRIFAEKKKPSHIPKHKGPGKVMSVADLLVWLKLATSKSEARRLAAQGGVRLNDARVMDASTSIYVKRGDVIQVGKRRFIQIN
jgi:tyrosyl-tRNA synthetase